MHVRMTQYRSCTLESCKKAAAESLVKLICNMIFEVDVVHGRRGDSCWYQPWIQRSDAQGFIGDPPSTAIGPPYHVNTCHELS